MNNRFSETFVPLFPGFYVSRYEAMMYDEVERLTASLSEQYPLLEQSDLHDMLMRHVDFHSMGKHIAQTHAEVFMEYLLDTARQTPDFEKTSTPDWRYERVVLPREYNFENDRLLVSIDSAFLKRLYGAVDKQIFAKVVHERHSSRSGFVSFYSDDVEHESWQQPDRFDANQNETLLLAFIEQITDAEDFGRQVTDTVEEGLATSGVLNNCFDFDGIDLELEEN